MRNTTPKGQAALPWKRDPVILARLEKVERMLLEGITNRQRIANALGVDAITIARDKQRLQLLWNARLGHKVEEMRAERIAALQHLVKVAYEGFEEDRRRIQSVLFDEPYEIVDCPGKQDHAGNGVLCMAPHKFQVRVARPMNGSAQYKGQGAALLETSRKAIMDAAKLMGLVVDKVSPTDASGQTLDLATLVMSARKSDDK